MFCQIKSDSNDELNILSIVMWYDVNTVHVNKSIKST